VIALVADALLEGPEAVPARLDPSNTYLREVDELDHLAIRRFGSEPSLLLGGELRQAGDGAVHSDVL
jgi:hypothetical protein